MNGNTFTLSIETEELGQQTLLMETNVETIPGACTFAGEIYDSSYSLKITSIYMLLSGGTAICGIIPTLNNDMGVYLYKPIIEMFVILFQDLSIIDPAYSSMRLTFNQDHIDLVLRILGELGIKGESDPECRALLNVGTPLDIQNSNAEVNPFLRSFVEHL